MKALPLATLCVTLVGCPPLEPALYVDVEGQGVVHSADVDRGAIASCSSRCAWTPVYPDERHLVCATPAAGWAVDRFECDGWGSVAAVTPDGRVCIELDLHADTACWAVFVPGW